MDSLFQETSDGWTILEVTRTLESEDSQDRNIAPGAVRIIWSYGLKDDVEYHEENRGAGSLVFYGSVPVVDLGDEVYNNSFLMPSAKIPSKRTSYICSTFILPGDSDGVNSDLETMEGHIIKIDPVVGSSSIGYVHHMLVYLCKNTTWFQSYFDSPKECVSPVGNFITGCESVLFGWARGMDSMVLPKEAGFRIGVGGNHAVRFLAVEIHYDNPLGSVGVTDNSGVRLHWTPRTRQHGIAKMISDLFRCWDFGGWRSNCFWQIDCSWIGDLRAGIRMYCAMHVHVFIPHNHIL